MTRISTEEFNKHGPYIAQPGDICYRHKDIFLSCETTNEVNNIIVYSLGHDTTRDLFYAIFTFIKGLYDNHGIEYISIYEERQWHMIERFFMLTDTNKRQHYAKISENLDVLSQLIETYSNKEKK